MARLAAGEQERVRLLEETPVLHRGQYLDD
jgi:hypothetical protein